MTGGRPDDDARAAAAVDQAATTELATPAAPIAQTTTDTSGVDDGSPAADGRGPRAAQDLIGTTLGRYRVLTRLGSGGMGVVWEALDPALDRKVAIKVLPSLPPERRAHLEIRLRREAQALARLEHPNVVAVYDVGVAADSVFVAMQLVDGATLDVYLARAQPMPARILAIFVDACRGLAAAHAAGIVHRDVKPSNLMVDRAGRVYVSDFGLARSGADDDADRGETSLLGAEMTRAGAVMGTPIYMAPEQHAGAAATARSDQFSLCVSLWQALFGRHPFVVGAWDADVARAAMRADRLPTVRGKGVAGRVLGALHRGLRFDPDARWPSMDALAAALTPRSKSGPIVAGLGVAGIVGAVVLTVGLVGDRSSARSAPPPCPPDPDRFAPAWSPARGDALRNAFAGSGRSYQADMAARVAVSLDRYRDAWVAARVAVCEATSVRHEQSSDLLDLRMRCLDERRADATALVDVLTTPGDAIVVDNAVSAVGGLAAPSSCASVSSDQLPLPADPEARAEIERLAAGVSGATALHLAGRIKPALEAASGLRAAVDATGYAPLRAALLLRIGQLQDDRGAYKDAEQALNEAASAGAVARDAALESRARTRLLQNVAVSQQRVDDVELVLGAATSALSRAGDRLDLRIDLTWVRALAESEREAHAQAVALADEAVALAERPDVEASRLHHALSAAAAVRTEAGDLAGAVTLLRRALIDTERVVGPNHPDAAVIHFNLAVALRGLGDHDGAVGEYQRALTIWANVFGRYSLQTVAARNGLATILAEHDRFDEAEPIFVELIKTMTDAKHPQTHVLVNNLGMMLVDAGQPARSLPYLREALAVREERLGPGDSAVAWTSTGLGQALRLVGTADALAEARAVQRRALAILEKNFSARHGNVAYPLAELAELELMAGHAAEAVRLAGRSLAARVAGPSEPSELELTRFLLARAEHARGNHPLAVDLARKARQALITLDDPDAREITAWLGKVGVIIE